MHTLSRRPALKMTGTALALILGLAVLPACSAKKPEAVAEAETAAGTAADGPVSKWTYDGATGPDHWAQLGGGSAVCANGQRQSPVDISGQVKNQNGKVTLDYNSSSATIQNTGKTVRIVPQNGGGLVLDDDHYVLKSIEFHSPSEHAINGHHATLESQFVHEDKDGHKVIVAVLYDIGVADPMLASLWTYLPSDPGQPVPMADLLINAQDLLPGTEDFYVYAGSLTTPPCTEGVTWMIYSSPLSISAEQADTFSRLIGPNARPIQVQHDRTYFHLTGF